MSSRSFFPSTTPLYQLLALFGGYRRSRPQPDTSPPLPRTTSRLILGTRLAAPSSLFLRWPHQALRHSGSTIATRPTRPRTARRPAQELAARGGVRGPKTHLEPPSARAPPTAPRTSKASTGRRPILPPLRPRYPSSSTSATRSVPGWGAVSLDVRDLSLALRYAGTTSGLSRPTEWRPARVPYLRQLRGSIRTNALRDPM